MHISWAELWPAGTQRVNHQTAYCKQGQLYWPASANRSYAGLVHPSD